MLRQKPTRKIPRKPTVRRPELDDLEKEQARLRKKQQELEQQIKVLPAKVGSAKKVPASKKIVQMEVAVTADEFGAFHDIPQERASSKKRPAKPLRKNRRIDANRGLIQFLILTFILLFFLYLLFQVIPS